jgi:Glycosyl-4,4'-diaponeurosporenoate acyltransferase
MRLAVFKLRRMRDVIIFVSAAAAFGVSLYLFGRAVGYTSPWFALITMFCFLGLVAFARPLFLLRLPNWVREVRAWEIRGGLYRALGVPVFGELLRRTPLRYFHPLVYLTRYPGDFSKVQIQIEGAEAVHLWAGMLIIPYMLYACVHNWWRVIFWFVIVQVVGNVYPILHLRWVRGRMKQVYERKHLNHAARNA